MKTKISYSPVLKTAAFFLTLLTLSACVWLSFVTLVRWDDVWLDGDYYRSGSAQQATQDDRSRLRNLMSLELKKDWLGELSYLEQEQLNNLRNALASEQTNFRYEVHNQAGVLLHSNVGGEQLEEVTSAQQLYTYHLELSDESTGSSTAREIVLECGVADPMEVEDAYTVNMKSYTRMQGALPTIAFFALFTAVISLVLLAYLCTTAGRNESGTLVKGWQERIPYELYLLLDFSLFCLLLGGGGSITYSSGVDINRPVVMGLGSFTLCFMALLLGLILTTAVRLKARSFNSLLGRLSRAICRFCSHAFRALPTAWRLVLVFLLYLVGSFLTAASLFLIPIYQGIVLWLLCRWLYQWHSIRDGIGRIVGGEPDFKIDTSGMFRDLRAHAEQLNDLGGAIGNAVDEQLRSERFKAELITNVSHDLKTPLTSIINYVGLLKKIPLENTQVAEYIDVLDRKSQRLKKLTEDLVDASKASTGNLTVQLERLGMGQLVRQALGEYEEKFVQQGLEVVFQPPEEECFVQADGRHLWRIVDNLFSNCSKYALEHTRIYLDMRRREGAIVLSVKNVSRQALNIPAEQLMERFVRGEEARSTDGSGLGLSIARSLTELQHGTFQLDIDGDLFKATLSFPEVAPPPTRTAPTA